MGVIREDLGALPQYVQESSESAKDGLFEIQEDQQRVTVVKFRVDNSGSEGRPTGCFRIEVRADTEDLTQAIKTQYRTDRLLALHDSREDEC